MGKCDVALMRKLSGIVNSKAIRIDSLRFKMGRFQLASVSHPISICKTFSTHFTSHEEGQLEIKTVVREK